jgi:hypothetical protein
MGPKIRRVLRDGRTIDSGHSEGRIEPEEIAPEAVTAFKRSPDD